MTILAETGHNSDQRQPSLFEKLHSFVKAGTSTTLNSCLQRRSQRMLRHEDANIILCLKFDVCFTEYVSVCIVKNKQRLTAERHFE